MGFEQLVFYLFAAVAVLGSLFVIVQRNPIYSVLALIGAFFGLSGLYVLLDAPFVAIVQIIIYAGAIMVLFLFVVMLLNVPREEPAPSTLASVLGPHGLRIGVVLTVLIGVEIVWALSRLQLAGFRHDAESLGVSSVALIGFELFTRHAFAFEATSILILVAMVGAIVIARRER